MEETLKEKEVISLSNDGLSSFTKRKEWLEFEFSLIDDGTGALDLDIKEVPTGRFINLIEDRIGLVAYSKRLSTIIKRQKIVKDDKVYFTKASEYPRNNFNRYSDSAKRVQSIDKATKIVVDIDVLNQLGNINGKAYKDYIIDVGQISTTLLEFVLTTEFTNNVGIKESKTIESLRSIYNARSSWGWGWREREIAQKIVKTLLEIPDGVYREYFAIMSPRTEKMQDSIDALYHGYNIDSFITDEAVNTYIDGYKDVIDDSNYDLLLSQLKGEDSQITLGMKLIENMDLTKSKPELFALFYNAAEKGRHNIRNNSVFRGIGMKNIRKQYDIDSIMEASDSYDANVRVTSIGRIHDKLSDHASKKRFIVKIKNRLIRELKEHIGETVFNLIKNDEEVII